MTTIGILGYPVSNRGLQADVDLACRALDDRSVPCCIACANPHSLVVAASDPDFAAALKNAELLLPDGAGIVLAARLLGRPLPGRVAGMDFFLELTRRARGRGGLRYFFLGSSPEVLQRIVDRLAREVPEIIVCGTASPPFKEDFSDADNAAMIAAVNAAKPDVLWVGMTAPKQEKWIQANRGRLSVPVIGAIGAVFDFYAGTRQRAPQWVCDLGLEWLPRLVREPRRLWRRNFISTPVFLARVLKQRFGRPSRSSPA
jgi:N-acetylglucosaminyldiphosphoundecaprenol N-acetyl-beta-D-mannosaminyltransferase